MIFMIATLFSTASALRCYICNSFMMPTCNDPFDNRSEELKPCKPNQGICTKIIQEAYWEGAWEVRYIRLCNQFGEIGAEDGKWCQQRVGTYRVKMRYCHCDNKDGCNAALPAAPTLSLAPLAALTAALTLLFAFR
jgi:hypothetical protein